MKSFNDAGKLDFIN